MEAAVTVVDTLICDFVAYRRALAPCRSSRLRPALAPISARGARRGGIGSDHGAVVPRGRPSRALDELVGRPGLDPGTLGLKVPCSSG